MATISANSDHSMMISSRPLIDTTLAHLKDATLQFDADYLCPGASHSVGLDVIRQLAADAVHFCFLAVHFVALCLTLLPSAPFTFLRNIISVVLPQSVIHCGGAGRTAPAESEPRRTTFRCRRQLFHIHPPGFLCSHPPAATPSESSPDPPPPMHVLRLGFCTGNPRVSQAPPVLYPLQPIPTNPRVNYCGYVRVFCGYGSKHGYGQITGRKKKHSINNPSSSLHPQQRRHWALAVDALTIAASSLHLQLRHRACKVSSYMLGLQLRRHWALIVDALTIAASSLHLQLQRRGVIVDAPTAAASSSLHPHPRHRGFVDVVPAAAASSLLHLLQHGVVVIVAAASWCRRRRTWPLSSYRSSRCAAAGPHRFRAATVTLLLILLLVFIVEGCGWVQWVRQMPAELWA
ncbi:hypothetical protein BDZ97DRAFT_1759841 [Flammula alnicola]|nr:hypothetical protein BDZ97DRAFT_1759841 [Flammula alnicola]